MHAHASAHAEPHCPLHFQSNCCVTFACPVPSPPRPHFTFHISHAASTLGRYREEVNTLLAQMYTRGASYGGKDPSSDIGVNVAVLKDDMNPEDVHPRTPGALRGKVCVIY